MATKRTTKTTKTQEPASLPMWLAIVAQAAEAKSEQLRAQAEAVR
jgi:hypothetical protein